MQNKLVSILIPCYNAGKYLKSCLDAILNQSYPNIELIIVNDGSTDDSEKIIQGYKARFEKKHKNLLLINQENQGQAAACNNGLKYIKGEYFYWQDADDVLEEDAIKKMVDFLELNPEFDMVRGNVSFRNEENFDEILRIAKPKNNPNHNIFNQYIFEKGCNSFAGVIMVRMPFFDNKNPDREIYISPGGQNYQLILPIAYSGKCGYIDEMVYKCRMIDNSHSHSVKTVNGKLKRCDIHQDIIFNVLNKINDMSNIDRVKYKIAVKLKYLKRKCRIIIGGIIRLFIIKK